MQTLLKQLRTHLPYVIGVVLVVANALVANGDLTLSNHAVDVVNALLSAFGLGVLHKRQQG